MGKPKERAKQLSYVQLRRRKSIGIFLASALFCWVGLIAAVILWMDSGGIADRSRNWPTTPGRILSDKVSVSTSSTREPGPQRHTYRLDLRYEYTVGGSRYEGTRIRAFTPHFSSKGEIAEFRRDYQLLNQVTVYYNPKVPRDAVLIPGNKGIGGIVLVAIVCFTLPLLLAFWTWKKT